MLRRLTVLFISLFASPALLAQPFILDDDDPDPPTIERLVKSLGSADYRRRILAMHALRKIGDLAVPYLERQQNSADLEVQRRVAELLTDIKVTGEVFSYGGFERGIIAIAMLPGDRRALTASEDRTVRLLDLNNGGELQRFEGHTKQVWAVAAAPDGKSFASGGQDRVIRLWNLDGPAQSRPLATLSDCVRCLQFSADGKRLLAGGFDRKIHVLDPLTGRTTASWIGHDDAVMCLALSPDGRTLLSGGGFVDQSVCVRDANTSAVRRRLVGHRQHVCAVAFVDNQRAVSAGYDNIVRLWNLETGKIEREFVGHQRGIYGLAVSRDGKRLLSGGYDKLIRLWDIASADEVRRFQQHEDGINALAFTANGRYALSAGNDRTVRLLYLPRTPK
jgi:WD40 repeat protein